MSASDKPSVCLVVLMGLPAAGKTTFAKTFVETFKERDYNVVHVCYDDFIANSEQAKLAELAESAQTVAQDDHSVNLPEENLAQSEQKSPKWKDRRKEILDGVDQFLNLATGSGNSGNSESETTEKTLPEVAEEIAKQLRNR